MNKLTHKRTLPIFVILVMAAALIQPFVFAEPVTYILLLVTYAVLYGIIDLVTILPEESRQEQMLKHDSEDDRS